MSEKNFTLNRAENYIFQHAARVNQTFKPSAHLSAPVGWINDPNGFVFFRGEYHLFYQYHPYGSFWGPMHWGHAKSKDLLHWEHLPVALAPDQAYDKDGCFSGSAIVKDDRLWLMYTGHILENDGTVRQVQNMAFSDDGVHFIKLTSNPVITGFDVPDIQPADFRDPKLFKKDNRYYAVVAAKHIDAVGCIVLLGSDNLEEWSFESIFLKGTKAQGMMWECPDYFNLDGQDCLIISPMQYPRAGQDFQNLNSNVICFGQVDWSSKTFELDQIDEIDHGHDFYAAQSLEDDQGRRIMIAWMQAWGRKQPTHDLGHGWAGMMTMARELAIENRQLIQRPVLPEKGSIVAEVTEKEGWQTQADGPLRLEIACADSSAWQLTIGNLADQVSLSWKDHRLSLDRSDLAIQLEGEEREPVLKRSIHLPDGLRHVTVFLDKAALEIFVNDGQDSMTSTLYIKENTVALAVQEGRITLTY